VLTLCNTEVSSNVPLDTLNTISFAFSF